MVSVSSRMLSLDLKSLDKLKIIYCRGLFRCFYSTLRIAANGKFASQESMRRHSVPQGYLYSIQGYSEGLL